MITSQLRIIMGLSEDDDCDQHIFEQMTFHLRLATARLFDWRVGYEHQDGAELDEFYDIIATLFPRLMSTPARERATKQYCKDYFRRTQPRFAARGGGLIRVKGQGVWCKAEEVVVARFHTGGWIYPADEIWSILDEFCHTIHGEGIIPIPKNSNLVFVRAPGVQYPYLLKFAGLPSERHVKNGKILREIGLDAYNKGVALVYGPDYEWFKDLENQIRDRCTGADCYWGKLAEPPTAGYTKSFGNGWWIPFPPTLAIHMDDGPLVVIRELSELRSDDLFNRYETVEAKPRHSRDTRNKATTTVRANKEDHR